jgi:dTDP-4-amino-4,6-dideoxygalactose transaminase
MEFMPVFVTQPSLPPLDEFLPYLKEIWESKWLTNNGTFHQHLEAALAEHLGVKRLSLFSSGMDALQTGVRVMGLQGEVITTPFTFVATPHAIHLNGCVPVFADIDPETLTLDPDQVEGLITDRTTAILPVHVYGTPCDHERLQAIADKHGLKLLYDAAHAFGVKKNGRAICEWGDLSILSFHATKVFSTCEGGAIVTPHERVTNQVESFRNFGIKSETTIVGPGINGKMDELRAAYGLLNLKYVEATWERRRTIARYYREQLQGVSGIRVLEELPQVEPNYGYFPVRVRADAYGMTRDGLYERLKSVGIYTRRYFYPLVSQLMPYCQYPSAQPGKLPVAERVAEEILCLPIYADLQERDLIRIVNVIQQKESI